MKGMPHINAVEKLTQVTAAASEREELEKAFSHAITLLLVCELTLTSILESIKKDNGVSKSTMDLLVTANDKIIPAISSIIGGMNVPDEVIQKGKEMGNEAMAKGMEELERGVTHA